MSIDSATKLFDDKIVKEFFTDSEWDLIYSLVDGNRQFCNDDEDPSDDYDSIIAKIHNLHKND